MSLGTFIKNSVGAIVAPVADAAKEPLKQWQMRKTIKAKGKMQVAIIEAKTAVAEATHRHKMAENGQAIEASWDARAQKAAEKSWGDDILRIVVIGPFVGCFFYPGKVKAGFEAMKSIPWEWRIAFLGVIASAFGLRWLIAPITTSMTKLKNKLRGD